MPGVGMWPCQRCGHAHGRPVTEAFMCSNRECYCCYPRSAFESHAQARSVAAAVTAPTADGAATDTSTEPPPSTDTEGRGGQGVRGDDFVLPTPPPKSTNVDSRQDALAPGAYDLPGRGMWSVRLWVHRPGDLYWRHRSGRSLEVSDGNRDLDMPTRQDCDDLIALLTEVRERLP